MPVTRSSGSVPARIRSMGRIHHVALIVRSIDGALGFWRDLLGLELETVMDIADDRVRIAFLGVGESKVELVEPTDETTGVARFLASKGEGFHHVCFEVANLAETGSGNPLGSAAASAATTAHVMGTARMGADPGGIVDGEGSVRGAERLVVADASVFPTSLGVNPQVTINGVRVEGCGGYPPAMVIERPGGGP